MVDVLAALSKTGVKRIGYEPARMTCDLFESIKSRYHIQAAQESTCKIRIARGPLVVDVLAALSKTGVKRIGYEPARMTCDLFESIKSRLPLRVSLEPVTGWIEELRMVKSAAELALIRRSVETNSRAFEQTIAHLKPGVRERDLAAELEIGRASCRERV